MTGAYITPITRFDALLGDLQAAATIWTGAGVLPNADEDRWVFRRFDSRLRIAAIDGITPTKRTARPAGGSGAAWAAGQTQAALEVPDQPLADALRIAHQLLYRPEVPRSRDRPMAAAAAADLRVSGQELQGDVAAVCDADVWFHTPQGAPAWQQLEHPSGMTPAAYEQFQAELGRRRALPGAFDWEDWFEAEDRLVGRRDAWEGPPLGRFPTPPTITTGPIPPGCSTLVVATDGARLDVDRVANLDSWMDDLRCWEHSDPQLWHGDVAAVRIRLTGAGAQHPDRGQQPA